MHLDPVLVGGVENEDWSPCNESGFMILYGYSFRFTEDECREALEFAHSHGLELIALGEDQPVRDRHIRCRPDQVLPYFRAADYVLTDTFHGTSLLDGLNLSDRRLSSIDKLGKVLEIKPDFESSDKIRSSESLRSLNYLRSYLSNGGVAE